VVVTQRQVGLAGALVLATAQDLEDQLVAVVAVLAEQHVQPLEGGGDQRLEPVPGEHRPDPRKGVFPQLPFGGEEIAGTRRRIELGWHVPMVPDFRGERTSVIPPCGPARRCGGP
jgi:hypothetical protein